jgi:hypothetical protein
MPYTCFGPQGSSLGRKLYIQLRYGFICSSLAGSSTLFYLLDCLYVKRTYRNCIYNYLPEDEPSRSKHLDDIKT